MMEQYVSENSQLVNQLLGKNYTMKTKHHPSEICNKVKIRKMIQKNCKARHINEGGTVVVSTVTVVETQYKQHCSHFTSTGKNTCMRSGL